MKAAHRAKQWVMCRTTGIISHEPELIRGRGALLQIPKMLKESGKERVLVTTTAGFIRRGTLEPFFDELEKEGIRATVFSNIAPDPTLKCVVEVVTQYVLGDCQAVVAIGGGSVIDCSKAAAARVVCPGKRIREMKGTMKIRKKLPDFYAVPTTAGTGSEATAAAVVTDMKDGRDYKYSINDTCLIPKCAVLDPELSVGLPKANTAATGMDALTHAVEAYTNKYPSALVKEKALDAVRLIYENLPVAFADGENIEARDNMLYASYEAGVAFTNNFVGYVHAVAHGIGGLYHMAHGQANAIILPYVMEQYGEAAEKPLAELAKAAGLEGEDNAQLAEAFIRSIRDMNESFGIPDKIEELREEDFEILVKRAVAEANYTYPVPAIWSMSDFRVLLHKLLK
ncbi:MAG: iron-containing alcohol dehydrogenase [Clostridia bacterium]|nr:iron-containing alcohol dehydrogenase [Clostridia bacterium]